MRLSRILLILGIAAWLIVLAVLLVPSTSWPAGIPNAIWAPDPKKDVGPLYGIAGVGPDDVWAVGRTATEPHKALIAHWDGRQWSVAERLSIIPRNHVLKDVVALSKDDVWAVGSYESGPEWTGDSVLPPPERTPLIVHWDGTHWEVVPIKIGGEGHGELEAIAATKYGRLWAVGTVLLRWDGTSWEELAMPQEMEGNPRPYYDIAAVADDDAWVVGYASVFHWDGATWKQVPETSSSPSSMPPLLVAVEVLSDNDVWMAGQSVYLGGYTHTFLHLLHWDGAKWENKTSPPSPGASQMPDPLTTGCWLGPCSLHSLAARSSNDIWLVGSAGWYPLVAHWDGTQWQADQCPAGDPDRLYQTTGDEMPSGNPGPLYDVAILGPTQVWAAGSRTFTEDQRRVEYGYVHSVLHGPCPPPKPTPTYPPTPTLDTRPRPTLPPPEQTAYPTVPAGPGTMVLPIPTSAAP